jgi:redox-sensitive bicupin YhaK (pirin superfamily)
MYNYIIKIINKVGIMSIYRAVKKITKGRNAIDGAGVKLVRVIGKDDIFDYDPFSMLDAFDSHNPDDYIKGFPWHPHRGMETIIYLIEGEIIDSDS